MPAAPLTEAEIDALLAQPMEISGRVQWVQKSNDVWAEATLAVRHPRREVNLTVRMTVNLVASEKFALSLLLDNSQRIRGVDVRGNHENKHTDNNRWVQQTHEHRWTDLCHGTWAAEPEPFPGQPEPPFAAFCGTVGIRFTGVWGFAQKGPSAQEVEPLHQKSVSALAASVA